VPIIAIKRQPLATYGCVAELKRCIVINIAISIIIITNIIITCMCYADEDPRPPPIIHQGPQNQTLPVNSLALLPCLATGIPAPSIRWYKNYKELHTRDPRFALLDSGTLQIAGQLPAVAFFVVCIARLPKLVG